MTKYHPNENGTECGRSALANLLLELNDPLTAQAVYDNFRKHELINNIGLIYSAFLPRVLRDITNGTYSGIFVGHLRPNLE